MQINLFVNKETSHRGLDTLLHRRLRRRRESAGSEPMKRIDSIIAQDDLKLKTAHRDEVELLRSRLYWLNGDDRLLMSMYLEAGSSYRQLARLTGLADTQIARKIRNLAQRLTDQRYVTCLRNRQRFTNDELAIAKNYFTRGLPIHKIAQQRNLTYYQVRQMLKKIQRTVTKIHRYSG